MSMIMGAHAPQPVTHGSDLADDQKLMHGASTYLEEVRNQRLRSVHCSRRLHLDCEICKSFRTLLYPFFALYIKHVLCITWHHNWYRECGIELCRRREKNTDKSYMQLQSCCVMGHGVIPPTIKLTMAGRDFLAMILLGKRCVVRYKSGTLFYEKLYRMPQDDGKFGETLLWVIVTDLWKFSLRSLKVLNDLLGISIMFRLCLLLSVAHRKSTTHTVKKETHFQGSFEKQKVENLEHGSCTECFFENFSD